MSILDRNKIPAQLLDRHAPLPRNREGASSYVRTRQARQVSCIAPGPSPAPSMSDNRSCGTWAGFENSFENATPSGVKEPSMSGTAPPKVAASSGQPAPSLPNATPSAQAVTTAGQPTVPLPPVPLAARHGWAAPQMCLAALASIAIPWIYSYSFSPLLISLSFTAGLSAAVIAVWSPALWLLAARTTDILPNTAAAGLSGGDALFGAGTVSILQQRLDTSPIPAAHWAVVTYIAECVVSGVMFISVLWSWSPARWQHRLPVSGEAVP